MKKIWFDNEELISMLEKYGICVHCGEDMELYVSDDDATLIPGIFSKLDVDSNLYNLEDNKLNGLYYSIENYLLEKRRYEKAVSYGYTIFLIYYRYSVKDHSFEIYLSSYLDKKDYKKHHEWKHYINTRIGYSLASYQLCDIGFLSYRTFLDLLLRQSGVSNNVEL